MDFTNLLNQVKQKQPITISDVWAQGRTVFGGVSTAMLYAAMRTEVESKRVLRSMNTSFVGPLKVGIPVILEVEVLRVGRSVTQVVARAIQEKQVAIVSQASFGMDRESRITVEANITHQLVEPEKGFFIKYQEGVTPPFLKHFDLSLCLGEAPFSNSSGHDLAGWMRFANTVEETTDAHLIAAIDVWPATILQMFDEVAPASSLSWNLEFIHPHSPMKADSWFAYEASTRQAAAGYAHTEANIWNQDGELIAISRQAVVAYQ